jgi:ribonuclease D
MGYQLYKGDLPDDLVLEGPIAVDTETMGLNNFRDKLCLVQLCDAKGKVYLVQLNRDTYDAPNLKQLLADETKEKIFHYARFDVAVIRHYLGVWTTPVYCTKIASKLARTYTDGHGLKDLCVELLGKRISKQQQSSDWGSAELSTEQMKYAAADVEYLHAIKERLEAMLIREGRQELAKQCFDFIKARTELDLSGWGEHDIFSHSSK